MRLQWIVAAAALAATPALAKDLKDFPVWAAMDGIWRGDLDYMDGDGEYITKDYNGIFDIRIEGRRFHQQNWMFYPPGSRYAAFLSKGLAGPDEGVEFIVNTYGEADGEAGDMVVTKMDHGFDFEGGERARVVSDTVVIYDYYDVDTGVLQHLQMVNLGAEGQRVRSSQGFDPNPYLIDPKTKKKKPNPRFGKVRGLSLYRETAMRRRDFDKVRAEFRDLHNVAVIVEAGPDPEAPSRIYRLDAEVTDCDWLANHPYDPRRVTAGVAREDVDLAAAVPACAAAAAADPDNPRLLYQRGRTLFYAGRVEEAYPFLERAAFELDYPQAQFVLGYLHDTPEGVAKDTCKAALLWRRAALQELFYAEYSFAKAVLEGRFADCAVRREMREIADFLASAQAKAAYTGLEEEIAELLEQAQNR